MRNFQETGLRISSEVVCGQSELRNLPGQLINLDFAAVRKIPRSQKIFPVPSYARIHCVCGDKKGSGGHNEVSTGWGIE